MVKDLQAEKHRTEFCFESVASMDAADKGLVSHCLGFRPVVACAKGLLQVKRKRYYWAS